MKSGIAIITLWTFILLGLMLAPIRGVQIPGVTGFQYFDKVAHLCLFFISGLVFVLSANFFRRFKAKLLFGMVFGLFLAIITEVIQAFMPFRSMSFYDLLADIIGLGIALAICTLLYRNHHFNRFFNK